MAERFSETELLPDPEDKGLVDANHEMAGKGRNFTIELLEVVDEIVK